MKCDKLQRYSLDVDYDGNVISVPNDDGAYMDASDVDAVLAEKDKVITELKQEIERLKQENEMTMNIVGMNLRSPTTDGRFV